MADGFDIGPPPDRVELPTERGVFAGLRWQSKNQPVLLFAHANGFCASAYKQILAPLSPMFDVVAIDLRGHGHSQLHTKKLMGGQSWALYRDDIVAITDALQTALGIDQNRPLIMAGHSLGATASIFAAKELLETGRRPAARICAIEPVMMPRVLTAVPKILQRRILKRGPLVKGARARRGIFTSREAAYERYQAKKPFDRWAPGVLADYLQDGLIDEVGDGARLACAPKWEAGNYAMPQKGLWPVVFALGPRLAVLGATHKSTTILSGWHERLGRAGALVQEVEGVTHLAPFENPALATEFINKAVAYH